jgi:hypothetical protein
MSSAPHLVIEIIPQFIRTALVVNDRVVAHREFAADDASGVAAYLAGEAAGAAVRLALLSPAAEPSMLVSAEESAGLSTSDALLARAAGGTGARVAACDAVKGLWPKADGKAAVLLAGMTEEAEAEARARLTTLGLTPQVMAAALPAELGAVVTLLEALRSTETVAVWVPGESSGKLWLVAASGILGVHETAAGFAAIFEAVQAELGLKFRSAASKLFLNGQYDFGEVVERIAARVGPILSNALAGETPAALHVVGFTGGQSWLVPALAKSLGLSAWNPANAAAHHGMSPEQVSVHVLGLLQAAAAQKPGGAWLPDWLTPGAALAETSPAPLPATPQVRPLMRAPQVTAGTPPTKSAEAIKPAAPAPAAATKPPAPTPGSGKAQVKASPAPVSTVKTFPRGVLIGGAAGGVLLAIGALFFFKSASEPPKTTVASAPAVVAETPARSSGLDPALQRALLESELKRDPLSFRNDQYAFTVSAKGVLTNLTATGHTSPWIKNLGFMRLYGVTMSADGRRVVRKAGDMSSPDYQARVVKQVRDGAIVFDVEVGHPKYSMTQTYVCLPHSVKVTVRFKPAKLSDNAGPLDAVYGVHLGAKEFTAPDAGPATRTGEVVYATRAGELILRYDPAFAGAGSKPVVADPELVSFVLAVNGGAGTKELTYEVVLP